MDPVSKQVLAGGKNGYLILAQLWMKESKKKMFKYEQYVVIN